MKTTRLHSRLVRVFLLHVVVISITVICGISAAAFVVEKVLVNRALASEAEYFWQHRSADPGFALPNTLNLQSYFDDGNNPQLPAELVDLPLGQQRVEIDGVKPIVHVSRNDSSTLYLIFREKQVQSLAWLFGVLPLILVLLTLYALSYFSFLQSKKAVSPIVALANRIESFDFTRNDSALLPVADIATGSDTEVNLLIQAFQHLSERMQALIDRERNFTRYASHELRTPLAVIKGSVSSLELATLDRLPRRALDRIKRTSNEMESLLDTLLILAREESVNGGEDNVIVNDLVSLLAEQTEAVSGETEVSFRLENQALLSVQASERVLSIVLGNIIRNARQYTEHGEIVITVDEHSVSVVDSGRGIEAEHLNRIFEPFFRENDGASEGYGLGLAIVKRICDDFGWQISVHSEVGKGMAFRIDFSPAQQRVGRWSGAERRKSA